MHRPTDGGHKDARIQADFLLKHLRSGTPEQQALAARRFQRLSTLKEKSEEEILARKDSIRRKHALQVVAIEHGFADWNALKAAHKNPDVVTTDVWMVGPGDSVEVTVQELAPLTANSVPEEVFFQVTDSSTEDLIGLQVVGGRILAEVVRHEQWEGDLPVALARELLAYRISALAHDQVALSAAEAGVGEMILPLWVATTATSLLAAYEETVRVIGQVQAMAAELADLEHPLCDVETLSQALSKLGSNHLEDRYAGAVIKVLGGRDRFQDAIPGGSHLVLGFLASREGVADTLHLVRSVGVEEGSSGPEGLRRGQRVEICLPHEPGNPLHGANGTIFYLGAATYSVAVDDEEDDTFDFAPTELRPLKEPDVRDVDAIIREYY